MKLHRRSSRNLQVIGGTTGPAVEVDMIEGKGMVARANK